MSASADGRWHKLRIWACDVLHPTTARTLVSKVNQVVPIGNAEAPRSPKAGSSNVVEDIVREVSQQLRLDHVINKVLTGSALFTIVLIGALMALMMWVATLEEDVEQVGIASQAPAPYWSLILLMWAGMLTSSCLLGFAFGFCRFRHAVRGSLEYTTLMIYNLKNGQQYGYREHVKVLDDDSYEARLGREKHQLKIEAGLAGWTEEAIDEQVALLEQAFQALNNLKAERKSVTENTPDSISRISVTVAAEHMEVVKSEAVKLFSMVKNTTKANNCIIGVVMCTFAIAVVGVGAMGGLLTVKIADMPDPDDNPLWIERCWQLINAIFACVAVWKGPQRILLVYHWFRKTWVHEIIDETGIVARSLLTPGVLLSHRQMGCVACLRIANIFFQYIVCFFMWAWLPRCLQEEKEQKIDCTSRPAWGVPVFLVMCIGTDVAANILLSTFIASCPYRKWPIQACDGPILVNKGVAPS